MVTIKPYLDCRRQKQDGTFPLKIRVSSNRKSFYLVTSFNLTKKYWDQKKSKVKSNYSNHRLLNLCIDKRILEIEELLLLHGSPEKLSIVELRQLIENRQKPVSVSGFARQLIRTLEAENKHGNALVYHTALKKLESHFGSNLSFEDLNFSLLTTFQQRMAQEGMSVNGISNYLRTIRALYNKAIQANLVDKSNYPFHRFKIKTEKTVVRALSISELQKLAAIEFEAETAEWRAHRLFFLSFALIGINVIDLAQLRRSDIQGERIHYKRQKTHKVYSVRINSMAKRILDELAVDGYYLLPLLPPIRQSSSEVKRISMQQTKNSNKHLKRIGEKLGLRLKLTTYVARHSWASTAKQLGYSNELIADAMGHSIGNSVTAVYLEKFSNEKIDEMNEEVCTLIRNL